MIQSFTPPPCSCHVHCNWKEKLPTCASWLKPPTYSLDNPSRDRLLGTLIQSLIPCPSRNTSCTGDKARTGRTCASVKLKWLLSLHICDRGLAEVVEPPRRPSLNHLHQVCNPIQGSGSDVVLVLVSTAHAIVARLLLVSPKCLYCRVIAQWKSFRCVLYRGAISLNGHS